MHRVVKRNQINQLNRTLVLRFIREQQSISRVDISRKTGLHKSTVTSIVKRLMEEDLVLQIGNGAAPPAGGRKPTLLSLNPNARKVLGVEIQPSSIDVVLADFSGGVHQQWSLSRHPDPKQCMKNLSRSLARIVARHGGTAAFDGVGISCPGIIDAHKGTLIYSSNLEWREVPIVRLLGRSLGLPVSMDNDTFLCALAELWFVDPETAGRMKEFAFVNVTEGLGVGLVINGELHRGFHSGSHNFGHMTIDVDGPQCRCGNRGCWETFASDQATVERYRRLSAKRRSVSSIGDLLGRAESGEPAAVEALETTATYLGIGIANMVNGLNLPLFVIGGEISSAWSLIERPLRISVEAHAFTEYLENVSIRPSSVGQQSALMGSIAAALSIRF
jgi:predicted NBD/HSP70 family sugar kinase